MANPLQIKVCGMRDSENIMQLAELRPDFMGFIFYEKSKRFAGDLDQATLDSLDLDINKVAVVVNMEVEDILPLVDQYDFENVQLHGDETPEMCQELFEEGVGVIKVFSVGEDFDFNQLEPYKPYCDFFLFDTKGKERGGNGVTFDWSVLKDYDNEVPFFISGGLSANNLENLTELKGMNVAAVDLNSCFEIEPGLKNIELLKSINFNELRNKLVN